MPKQELEQDRNWYAVHTYAGYEDTVARNLRQRIESLGMSNQIFDVIIPTEKKIKVKGNKRVVTEEKIYPGYVLVDMRVTDESWFVVRNTPRVTGIGGTGITPVPLSKKEMEEIFSRMNVDTKHKMDIEMGDAVKIEDGPFKELEGKVNE